MFEASVETSVNLLQHLFDISLLTVTSMNNTVNFNQTNSIDSQQVFGNLEVCVEVPSIFIDSFKHITFNNYSEGFKYLNCLYNSYRKCINSQIDALNVLNLYNIDVNELTNLTNQNQTITKLPKIIIQDYNDFSKVRDELCNCHFYYNYDSFQSHVLDIVKSIEYNYLMQYELTNIPELYINIAIEREYNENLSNKDNETDVNYQTYVTNLTRLDYLETLYHSLDYRYD